MKNSLSAKLLVNTASVLLAIIAVVFVCYLSVVRWGSSYLFERELKANAQQVIKSLHFDEAGNFLQLVLPPRIKMRFDALPMDLVYRILDADGKVLLASDHVMQPFSPWVPPIGANTPIFEVQSSGLPAHVLTAAFMNSGRTYYVQMARSDRFQRLTQEYTSRHSWLVVIGVSVLSMLAFSMVVWLTFKRSLRPLSQASDAASRIEPGNLSARLEVQGMPLEVLPLVEAFNATLARLERGYRVQREFLATAAHELKTPLTLMRGQLELDGLSDSAPLLQDVERMSRQVQQLLNLAECSEPQNYIFETIDINLAAVDVATHLLRLAQQRDVRIYVVRYHLPPLFRADPSALFVLMKNLLENAIQHSSAGKQVQLVVGADHIVVRDHGVGIPEADMPMLFKRFWRGSHRRDEGAGLGLAICREIALAHDWVLSAKNATPGAEFMLRLCPARLAADV